MSFIYVVRHPDGLYKVGHSAKPFTRMKCLQANSARPLAGVAVFASDTPASDEKAIRDHLQDFQVFDGWFSTEQSDILSTCRVCTQSEKQDFPIAVEAPDTGQKRAGLTLSVTPDERERINTVCDTDGRSIRAMVMWLIDRRMRELQTLSEIKGSEVTA